MKIRTIACSMDHDGIYISDKLWHNPKFAIRNHKLLYIGKDGWYPDKKCEKLFNVLNELFEINTLHNGEYMEVDFDYNEDFNWWTIFK